MLRFVVGALITLSLIWLGETGTIQVAYVSADDSSIGISATADSLTVADQVINGGEACLSTETSGACAINTITADMGADPATGTFSGLDSATKYTILVDNIGGTGGPATTTDAGSSVTICTTYTPLTSETTTVEFDEDDDTLARVNMTSFDQNVDKYVVNYEYGGNPATTVESASVPVEITVLPATVYSFTITAQLEGCDAAQGTVELAASADDDLCSEWYTAMFSNIDDDCVDDESDDTLEDCTGSFTVSDGDTSLFSGSADADFDAQIFDDTATLFGGVIATCTVIADTDTSVECAYVATGLVKETNYTVYASWSSVNCGIYVFEVTANALMIQATFLAMTLSLICAKIF